MPGEFKVGNENYYYTFLPKERIISIHGPDSTDCRFRILMTEKELTELICKLTEVLETMIQS